LDFSWSEEQEALRRSVTQFAQNELTSDGVAEDQAQEFSWDGWRKCARFGIQGMPAPGEYGGGDADILTMVCALEALGYGCRNAGLIFSLNAHLWGTVMPLSMFGSDEQKRQYLPQLANGDLLGGQALVVPGLRVAEADSASRDGNIRAERSGDGWRLNGAKPYVANSAIADLIVVNAATADGPTAFVVEKGMSGVEPGSNVERMGLRTSPAGSLALTNCAVPDANRLGDIGSGGMILKAAGGWDEICVLAAETGMMQRQFETSTRYAAERRQFGQPIAKFPAVAEKIARMDARLETARLVLYKAAWLRKQGRSGERESAIARSYVTEAAVQTCRDALQIHGGYGYMTEYQIERDLRDAISLKIFSN
jgi:alkylation response protein AidB-like acyl-CoA dehydrogenase